MLEQVLFYLALLTLLVLFRMFWEFYRGNREISKLTHLPPLHAPEKAPKVSVIIPARNEEQGIEEALQSILRQDYPCYEVIVLNDRSDDRTGEILEEMARENARLGQVDLKVVHLTELPKGWIGKNYALYQGTQVAQGSLYLFTDADVEMDPSTLSRAVQYLQEKRLNHLTIAPLLQLPGLMLNAFLGMFTIFFAMYAKPWNARKAESSDFIGVGAFNLIQAATYNTIGTHQAIALRPDDDMKLGKLVKKHGFRQDVVFGQSMVRVKWYASLGDMIEGLMKNAFSGVEYRLSSMIFGVLVMLVFWVWPVAALWVTDGPIQLTNLCVILLALGLYMDNARFHEISPWYAIFYPLSTLLIGYILLRAAFQNTLARGIYWRGTFYALEALKTNKV